MKQKMIRHPYSTFSSFLKEHNNILKESLIALLICACGDLVAGIVLGRMDIFLENFPGLLVIIPGAIGMRETFLVLLHPDYPQHYILV